MHRGSARPGNDISSISFSASLKAWRSQREAGGGRVPEHSADMLRTWICASRFDRRPAGRCDLEANDLDRLGASLDGLAFRSGKPGAHETSDHVAIKSMSAHEQRLGSAMRAAGEQP